MMPALGGGGGRCGAPLIWDCSNINVSGAPPRLFKYQRPPYYALLGCKCEGTMTTGMNMKYALPDF